MPKASAIRFLSIGAAILLQVVSTPSFSAEPVSTEPKKHRTYISIIIDDIGYNRSRGQRAIDLPAPLTYAVIPDARHAITLSRYAHRSGKEVMLHLPMENVHNQPLGGIALTSGLNRKGFSDVFEQALNRVPFARGINNHMGSSLTQEPLAMSWLMESVARHKLFFVDSRTTHKTVASTIAQQRNILSASRDVFLDNDRNLYDIDRQFRRLLRMAQRKTTAVAIGHPYRSTLQYLSHAIPLLEEENIEIIPVSEMIKLRLANQQIARVAPAVVGGD